MNALAGFLKGKAASLVSKKLGMAGGGAAVLLGAGQPELAGWLAIAYVAVQGLVDLGTLYINRRWPEKD